ncbi:MAG: SAM-dependent methyltransferase [Trebonia sp.]
MSTDEAPAPGTGEAGRLPFDITRAHQARMYDYLLGGKDNYAADRVAADAAVAAYPDAFFTARANRAFLGRVVRYLADEAGVRQFLDIGTGIPTAGNTHEVAQAIAPESRVVYVDYDRVVLAHARALLGGSAEGATEYIDADLRDTAAVLARAADLLDFSRPVAVTMLAILHAIPDGDDPHAIVAKLMAAVPSGSYLAISHVGSDLLGQEAQENIGESFKGRVQQEFTWRGREQVGRFFEGTDLVEPGVVLVEEWRPEPGTVHDGMSAVWGAVGRKR